MEIISNKEEMIFRKDYKGEPMYSIGLSKKDKQGNFMNGYITANFKKGTDIPNRSKIKIKEAWLSFYQKDRTTIPTIFVNDYEIAQEPKKEENPYEEMKAKVESDFGEQIQLTDDDYPF